MTTVSEDLHVGFTVHRRVDRPPAEVFDAVVNPIKLCSYFTATCSGALQEGKTVRWAWSDGQQCDVRVLEVVPDEKIVFSWEGHRVDYDLTCTFTFKPIGDGATRVAVHETGWKSDQAGLDSSYDQCSGWTHMLMCLKARLEHDIDLRS